MRCIQRCLAETAFFCICYFGGEAVEVSLFSSCFKQFSLDLPQRWEQNIALSEGTVALVCVCVCVCPRACVIPCVSD